MSNLTARILSAAVLIPPVVLLAVYGPPLAFGAMIACLAGLGGLEYGQMALGHHFPGRTWVPAALAGLLAAAVSATPHLPYAPLLSLALLVPLAVVSFMFASAPFRLSVPAAMHSAAGAAYVGGLFGFVALVFQHDGENGRYWVLLLAAATFLGDTMAYTVGRLFGVRKLAPRLSPGKTWAGAFGGLLGSVAAVAVCRLLGLPGLTWPLVPLIGVCLSVACQLGDLVESFIKRGLGHKDSGTLIPGHGGVLDRCDALIFGAPTLYLILQLRPF